MLVAVETLLSAALKAALPGVQILTGPAPGVPAGASVQVLAGRMTLAPPSQDLGDERGASRLFTLHSWSADGVVRSFQLPPLDFEVAEVEAPPGRPRARGDDYRVDAGALKFQRPPPAPGVRALLLGAPARGFVERRRCELGVLLTARAPADLDALGDATLAAALRACVEPPELEAQLGPAGAAVRVRLRRPVATLLGVTRRAEAVVGGGDRARCDIELIFRGEAELTVAVGTPDPVDRIAQVLPGEVDVG